MEPESQSQLLRKRPRARKVPTNSMTVPPPPAGHGSMANFNSSMVLPVPEGNVDDEDEDDEDDEDGGSNAAILKQFVTETVQRAEELVAKYPELTVPRIMKSLGVRGPIEMARRKKKRQSLMNFIMQEEKAKTNIPIEKRGQVFHEGSGKNIPDRAYGDHVRNYIMKDEGVMENYRNEYAEKLRKISSDPLPDNTPSLQKKGLKALRDHAVNMQLHGIYSIILAVGNKYTQPVLYTSKGFGDLYWGHMQKNGCSITDFRDLVCGMKVLAEINVSEESRTTKAPKTRADGKPERTDLRDNLRVRLLEAISKHQYVSHKFKTL